MKVTLMQRAAVLPVALLASLLAAATSRSPQNQSRAQFAIPDQLQHATPFVEFLRGAGLTIREVHQSRLTAMFGGTRQAAYISTSLGVVEVVVFSGVMEAESITITYSKRPAPTAHHYLIQGGPTGGVPKEWHGAQPAYFTLHGNWFIVTWQPDLEAFLKRNLGQTSRPDLLK